jgi:hypothetical protein
MHHEGSRGIGVALQSDQLVPLRISGESSVALPNRCRPVWGSPATRSQMYTIAAWSQRSSSRER